MKKNDHWQALLMPVPQGFHSRVEETLKQIDKDANAIKRRRKREAMRALTVALVAALLLAGTALAVGRLTGILDFARPRVEEEEARQYIEQDLAAAQSDRVRLTVREGYYDGEVARIIVEIAPVRAEDCVDLRDWRYTPFTLGDAPTAGSWTEGAEYSIGLPLEEIGPPAEAENRIALIGAVSNYTEDGATGLEDCRAAAVREGNAVALYIEGRIHSYTGEVRLGCCVWDENGSPLTVGFVLKAQGAQSMPLELGEAEFAGIVVQEASIQHTPFATFLEVTYAPALSGETIGESGAYDPAGIYYATEYGMYAHAKPACNGMANATEWTGQELMDIGRPPCPDCMPVSEENRTGLLTQGAWSFDFVSEEGRSLLDADSPWMQYDSAALGQPRDVYILSFALRPDAALDGVLYLRPVLVESGAVLETPLIPCWLAEAAPIG